MSAHDVRVLSSAAFFEGEPAVLDGRLRSVLVDEHDAIRAQDDVGGHYTICHSIPAAEAERILTAAHSERAARTVADGRRSQALAVAAEYRSLAAVGRVAEAGQCRRTLDDLGVGHYVDGRWVLDADILRAMGLSNE